MSEPLTEDWLRDNGFKWHQLERQAPDKHWLLWLGHALADTATSFEDLGIEVAPNRDGYWFCWLRADYSGRYSRFLHVRHISSTEALIAIVEGLTGQKWDPTNNLYGAMRTPEQAKRLRAEHERLDRRIMRENPWRDIEKDDTRGRALPEHMEHHAKTVVDGKAVSSSKGDGR